MKLQKLLSELKRLNLPKGQYAIFGSGPIAVRGLREVSDLDIIVKPNLFNKLKKKYPQKTNKHPFGCLNISNIEIGDNWQGDSSKIKEMIDNSEEIGGFSFVKLSQVKEWKQKMGRRKDKQDIKLIKSLENN